MHHKGIMINQVLNIVPKVIWAN